MGRKLDLTGLTEDEAEHVLQVVQRDMSLRKKEEERLSELRQELDDEGSRCSLLSRQHRFNERCCIRCCSPFTFLLNPRRQCLDCQYNVCRSCCSYTKKDKAWVCMACQKGRLLKTQSLEWYYNNVKCRFKRFGSAKVLKTLYRKHLVEHGTLGEVTEGSTYEESIGTEGSVCSDSAFYRQSEEHSMADTLRVALRVAEEAIDEAIAKAEEHTDSQDKQSEAKYLQEHREELVEELASTIVQKIIRRRKNLADMKPDYDLDWPPDNQSGDEPLASSSPSSQAPNTLTTSGRAKASLWRSRSAFSLLDDNDVMQCSGVSQDSQKGLDKKGALAGLASWRSVDRLDNSSASSVLKSPDGNWIALQSTQLSRPSLLTRRKSLLFSVLEKESDVASAYDQIGTDDPEGSEGAWGAALLEIRRKMSSNANNNQGSEAPDPRASSDQKAIAPSPSLGHHVCSETLKSDFEVQGGQGEGQSLKPKKSLFAFLKRKVSGEHLHAAYPRRSSRPGIFDVNFNPEGARPEVESSGADELEEKRVVRKSRRRKRSKKEHREERGKPCSNVLLEDLSKKQGMKNSQSGAITPDTQTSDGSLTSGALTPDPGAPEWDAPGPEAPEGQGDVTKGLSVPLEEELAAGLGEVARQDPLSSKGEEPDRSGPDHGERDGGGTQEEEEMLWQMEVEMEGDGETRGSDEGGRTGERDGDGGGDLKSTLIMLASQARGTEFSSTEDELDRVGLGEEGESGELTAQLRLLASQVSQYSSTEDELDRASLSDGEMDDRRGERQGGGEELTSKLCRLARQVGAAQFSSTDDELDRVGLDEDDAEDEEMEGEWQKGGGERDRVDAEALWEMEGDKEEMTSKLRDLASLVSASQFSSTDDDLDRVGEEDREGANRWRSQGDRVKLPDVGAEWLGGGVEMGKVWNRGRQGEVELTRTKPWYLGVMMAAEGRMMNQERKDSMGDLDARLFDFQDKCGREGDESSLERVMNVQRMMEEMFRGQGGERTGGVERKSDEGGGEDRGGGGQERGRTDSVDTVDGEEAFDNVISGLVDAPGGIEVDGEIRGEVEVDGEITEEVEVDVEITEEVKVDGEITEEVELDGEIKEEVEVDGEITEEVEVDGEIRGEIEVEVDGEITEEVEVDGEITEEVEVDGEITEEVEVDGEITEEVEVDGEIRGEIEVEVDGEITEEVEVDEEIRGEVEVDGEFTEEVEVDVEIRGEVEVEDEVTNTQKEQREEDKNSIQVGETGFRMDEEVDDVVLDKMLMLEKLSDTPGERDGGKDRETENRIDTWDQTEDRMERAGEEMRDGRAEEQMEEQTQTETSPRRLPQSLDDGDERESEQNENKTAEEVEEDSSEVVERGEYVAREGENQRGRVREVLGEIEEEGFEESREEEEEKDTMDHRAKEPAKSATSVQEEILSSVEIRNSYSAVSLRGITTEVLKVLNATEDILQRVEGGNYTAPSSYTPILPPNTDPRIMDEELSRLEENVYVAASAAYGLEAELGDLEECVRAVGGATSDLELSYLEEQVASAAAQVHQSDLQVSNISARITALKNAGLNVVPQNRFTKPKKEPKPQTLDSSRQMRRRLPAPPPNDKET